MYSPSSRGGGVSAVAGPRSGGASYGAPTPRSRPVATLLDVSSRVKAGSLPTVRFRIDERDVSAVDVRLDVAPAGGGDGVSLHLGSRPTGSLQAVDWPSGTRLAVGRWTVRVHATDRYGHRLRRTAKAAGSAALTVFEPRPVRKPRKPVRKPARTTPPPAAVAPPAATPPAATPPADTPSSAGTFPVVGPHAYGDGFGAGRVGHVHQGQDILVAEGTPVVAPVAGTIIARAVQASAAGFYLTLHGTDGRDYFFAHCEAHSFAVELGQSVSPGQRLCLAGHTGDATGPHLHFEIWVGGWATGHPIDPLPQLKAWDS